MLIDNLESLIYEHNADNMCIQECVNFIVMHPTTWRKIITELLTSSYIEPPDYTKYKGIQIYRTFDIKEDEFKIG